MQSTPVERADIKISNCKWSNILVYITLLRVYKSIKSVYTSPPKKQKNKNNTPPKTATKTTKKKTQPTNKNNKQTNSHACIHQIKCACFNNKFKLMMLSVRMYLFKKKNVFFEILKKGYLRPVKICKKSSLYVKEIINNYN